jgi:pimeloyl-ACP methyl ester carboxylesterase
LYGFQLIQGPIFAHMNLAQDTQGNLIAYYQHGKGDLPLVLIHGFCEDSSIWEPILTHLFAIPVICIDLPGFGKSAKASEPSMSIYSDAIKAVLDQTQTKRCVLVGHSMGGYAALEFVATYPEQLIGLGLFHSHPFTDQEERKIARKRGIETVMAGKRDLYVTQLFPNLFAPEFQIRQPQIIQTLTEQGKRQSAVAITNALQAMLNRRDHQETLTRLSCPALFLLGKKDTLIPYKDGLIAGLLPNISEIQVLDEIGHMGMWEAAEECGGILDSFWHFCINK